MTSHEYARAVLDRIVWNREVITEANLPFCLQVIRESHSVAELASIEKGLMWVLQNELKYVARIREALDQRLNDFLDMSEKLTELGFPSL